MHSELIEILTLYKDAIEDVIVLVALGFFFCLVGLARRISGKYRKRPKRGLPKMKNPPPPPPRPHLRDLTKGNINDGEPIIRREKVPPPPRPIPPTFPEDRTESGEI